MEDTHMNPEYLFHGSQYKLDTIEPRQACGQCDNEAMQAIYAAETLEEVVPFALPIRWYPDTPEGRRSFECENGMTHLIYGSLDPNGRGYIYRLRADTFRKIDGWQWVSETACVPVEVIEISVKDWLHTVKFSQEAEEINRTLYGEDGKGIQEINT